MAYPPKGQELILGSHMRNLLIYAYLLMNLLVSPVPMSVAVEPGTEISV